MDEILKLVRNETLSSPNLTISKEIDYLGKFFNTFYWPTFHCLRYLWYVENNKPKGFNINAFHLYIYIRGMVEHLELKSSNKCIRYNVFEDEEGNVSVIEIKQHKQEVVKYLMQTYKVARVLWLGNMEFETIQLSRELFTTQSSSSFPPIESPTQLVSKTTIGVDLSYCSYCCYQKICN